MDAKEAARVLARANEAGYFDEIMESNVASRERKLAMKARELVGVRTDIKIEIQEGVRPMKSTGAIRGMILMRKPSLKFTVGGFDGHE